MTSPTPHPALFLDRDGTVIEDRGHLASPSEAVLYPDSIPALLKLQPHFKLFLVTNQSGIAKGLITREQADAVNSHVVAQLAAAGIRIERVYVCPHQRTDGCECIKPKPFFPREAERDFNLDLARSYSIGDHGFDVELALNVGGTGLFVRTGHGSQHEHEMPAGTPVFDGIGPAAEWILARL